MQPAAGSGTDRNERLLAVRGLRTSFFTYEGEVRALSGVDIDVRRGEVLGLVGESGAGKSTAVWSIMNLVPPPGRILAGTATYRGQDLLQLDEGLLRRIRGKDMALIVPNARSQLNPTLPVGQQLANVVLAHRDDRIGRGAALQQAIAMMRSVGIPDPERRAQAYPHQLSGGMAQRIIIGMALMHSPTLLIADEPTHGLDVTIQAQVLETFRRLIAERHAAALLVTRDLGIVAHYCDRAAVMYGGEIVEETDTRRLFGGPLHPYTRQLLTAVRDYAVEGKQPDASTVSFNPVKPPKGCFFYGRCPDRMDICREDHPELREVALGHKVRCHRHEGRGNGV